MAKSADRYLITDPKKIVEKGFDPAHALASESVFSLANEHMGVRGYFEEGGGESLRGSYLGDVYETQEYRPESDYRGFVKRTQYMVTSADCLATRLIVNGETLDLSVCAHRDFTRVLDMGTGLLTRSFLWETRGAGRVEVCFERLLGMDRPELLAQRVTLCALDGDAETELVLSIDGNVPHRSNGLCRWTEAGAQPSGNALLLFTESTKIAARYTQTVTGAQTLIHARGYRSLSDACALTLARGREAAIERMVAVQTAHPGKTLPPAPEEKAANYAFYEPRCLHESSLSPSVHAILAGEIGLHDEALRFFGFATRLDLDNDNRNTREGLHLSNVAAAWVTMMECFGGVRFDGAELRVALWLPAGWKGLRFSLRIRDSALHIHAVPDGAILSCEGTPLALSLYGERLTVGREPVRRARVPERGRRSFRLGSRCSCP